MSKKSKEQALSEMMARLGVEEKDLVEKFILGSGPGGQKIQKTHSCVHLQHLPSGIQVKCQESRLREENRFFARRELCLQLEERLYGRDSKRGQAILAKRKQKKRRKRRADLKHSSAEDGGESGSSESGEKS